MSSQKLKKLIKAARYQIVGVSAFLWRCYGSDARYLDLECRRGDDEISVSCIFDARTHELYQVELWYNDGTDAKNPPRAWFNRRYLDAYAAECKRMGVDPLMATEKVKFSLVSFRRMIKLIRRAFTLDRDGRRR